MFHQTIANIGWSVLVLDCILGACRMIDIAQDWDDHQLSSGLSEGWLGNQNMKIEILGEL